MWTEHTAPSDRDYYDQFLFGSEDAEPRCDHCGASDEHGQPHEEWCETNHPAQPQWDIPARRGMGIASTDITQDEVA